MTAEATCPDGSSPTARVWASLVLGLHADASPQQLQAAALQHLEKAGFVPPPPLEQAVLLLADKLPQELWARDRGGQMILAQERALCQDVDRLAREFFTLEPAKRRTIWQAMKEAAASSLPLRSRLDALAAGLDVTPPAFHDDSPSLTGRLVRTVCEAFVMLPSARAACHEEQIQRAMLDPRPWQSAARAFRHRYPQLVPLAPELIASLSQATRLCKAAAKRNQQLQKKERQAAARQDPKSRSRSYTWLIVFLAISLSRALSTAFRTDSPSVPSTSSLPSYSLGSSPQLPPQLSPARRAPPPLPSATYPRNAPPGWSNSGVLPPPGPGYIGEKIPIGDTHRRTFNVPDDIDLYREDGKYVFRRRATQPSAERREIIPSTVPPDRNGHP